jgi:streptogramin lyase
MALFAALMLSGRISSRTTGKRTLRRLLLVISFTFLIATFASERAVATIIIEKTLPTDGRGARSPFGIDTAQNSSFIVFAEKHAGKIGFMGTGQCRLGGSFNGTFIEFNLPESSGVTAEPRDVGLGNLTNSGRRTFGVLGANSLAPNATNRPELYVWFTEFVRNRIGRLYLGRNGFGSVVEFTVPTPNSGPWNLAIDPYNGSIWFTEYQGNKIGRLFFNPGGSYWRFMEYSLPTLNSYPVDIAVDPNFWTRPGNLATPATNASINEVYTYVWFTMSGSDKIGRLNSETGEIVEFSTRGTPWGITVTPQSFVWFTQKLGDRIAKLHPWSGIITEISLPVHSPGNEPLYIANDTDNNLWFTESANNIIGKYVPGMNIFQEYVVPTTASKPHGIVLTPRLFQQLCGGGLATSPINHTGTFSVFFTEEVGNKIGKIIIPSGTFITTTTVGYVSSASTTTTSATTLTTAATSTVATQTSTTTQYATHTPTLTYQNVTTTIMDTVSVQVTSTTSTWTKTTTSTTVTTASQTSTSVTTSTSTSGTTTTVTSTSTTTSTSSTTTTTTTSTTYTSTSYSPTVTTPVTVGTTSMYSSTTTTTTTSTATQTSAVLLTTTTTTVATATVTPAGRACVIASVAYGSELAPEVQFLRGFRDGPVVATFAGAQFMSVFNAFYYSFSPKVAEVVAGNPVLQPITRALIYPLLGSLRLAAEICQLCPQAPQLTVVIAGVITSGVIGLVYVSPILVLFGTVLRKVKDPRGE